MSTLVYTFRTVDLTDKDVFVFSQLRKDLDRFFQLIIQAQPALVIGVGNAAFTRYEQRAINRFHGKKIVANGSEFYDLYVPATSLHISTQPTESFCNWTAYHIARFVTENNLNMRVSFLHVSKKEREVPLIRGES